MRAVKLSNAQSIDARYGLEPVIDLACPRMAGRGAACNVAWSCARIADRASKRQLTRVPAPHTTLRTAGSAASRSTSASKSITLAYFSHYLPCAAISD